MAEEYFQVAQVGAANVISLRLPEATDSNEFDRLNEQVLEVFEGRPKGLWILDLSSLDYMGSSALGLMVNIRQRILKTRGQLVLCGLSPQLLRIFRTCCMERLFRIARSQADAMKTFVN